MTDHLTMQEREWVRWVTDGTMDEPDALEAVESLAAQLEEARGLLLRATREMVAQGEACHAIRAHLRAAGLLGEDRPDA